MIILLIISIMMFVNCNNSSNPSENNPLLTGVVMNRDGEYIDGSPVSLFPDSIYTYTDTNGIFKFESFKYQSINLRAMKDHYLPFDTIIYNVDLEGNNDVGIIYLDYRKSHTLSILNDNPIEVKNNSICSLTIKLEESTIKRTYLLPNAAIQTKELKPYYSYVNQSDSIITTNSDGVAKVQYEIAVPDYHLPYSFELRFLHENELAEIIVSVEE